MVVKSIDFMTAVDKLTFSVVKFIHIFALGREYYFIDFPAETTWRKETSKHWYEKKIQLPG